MDQIVLATRDGRARGAGPRRFVTFLHALGFVLGFMLVFVVGWGGATTVLGQLFGRYKIILGQLGGAVVIVFGLATLGVVRIPWLYYDTRPQWSSERGNGLISSTLMGVFFAAGWTPCIGTTLGAILTLSFSADMVGQAMLLSSGYALGLGLPFLAIGLAMDHALAIVRRFRRYQRPLQIASGVFLMLIGLMLITGRMALIAIWAQRNGYYLDLPLGAAAVPSYLIAALAGLLSFLSPCVLPLVPAYIGYLSGQAVGGAQDRIPA